MLTLQLPLPDSSMVETPAHNGLDAGLTPAPATTETLTETAKRLEHYETPEWAAHAILRREILTRNVVDPCTGTGILAEAALREGYNVAAYDIHDWGYARMREQADFLSWQKSMTQAIRVGGDFTVFMNPPFSKAVEFVEKALELGARKVVCFQRFACLESKGRRDFWEKNPPNRIYICGDRATCWRHDIPIEARNGNVSIAHAWFVWERGNPAGTLLSHIWREDVE